MNEVANLKNWISTVFPLLENLCNKNVGKRKAFTHFYSFPGQNDPTISNYPKLIKTFKVFKNKESEYSHFVTWKRCY